MSDPIARLNDALEGRYSIEGDLGEGGMATVYLAHDQRHDRSVAIKVLRPELAAVIGAERFLAEIKTTANLQHPHILPLFDSGEADGLLFYVMPYVEGETLRQKLDREGQLSVEEAVRLSVDLASALDYAHRHGVIHRDIKPANILLSEDQPLIADFGIAKAMSTVGGGRMTETGMSLGTPSYMSPEQAAGDQTVTAATDIYSLACVLYEMLVGAPPYTGPTAQAILARILSEEPTSTTAARKTVPLNVDAAIAKALERVPADRFSDTGGFAAALTDPEFRHGSAVIDETIVAARRWKQVGVAALGTLAVVTVVAILGWTRPAAPPEVSRYAVGQTPEDTMIPVFYNSLAISPDGSRLVYSGSGDVRNRALWVKERNEVRGRKIPGTDAGMEPFFFPDGDRIGFFAASTPELDRALKWVSFQSGEVRTIADSGFSRTGAAAAADGSIVLSSAEGDLVRLTDSMESAETIAVAPEGFFHAFPEVLPDDRAVIFSVLSSDNSVEDAKVALVDLSTGEQRTLVPDAIIAKYVPSGHLLYVRSDGSMLATPFDVRQFELTGEAIPIAENVPVGPGQTGTSGVDLAVSASGMLAYTVGRISPATERRLVWVRRDGSFQEIDRDWTAFFEGVALSPDETRIATTIGGEAESGIWIKSLAGGAPSRLTFEEGSNRRPSWAPDGQSVVFISDRGENRDLYSKRSDGLGEAEIVLDLPVTIDEGAWSRDEDWLILRTGMTGEERDVAAWRVGADPEDVLPVAARPGVDEIAPALSPDGRFVAYVSVETGTSEIWVRTFPDVNAGRWQVSLDGGTEPVWARDGSELFYRSQGNLVSVAVDTEPTFSRGEEVTLFPVGDYLDFDVHRAYDVSQDGERFLMIRTPEALAPELIVVENFVEELKRRSSR